LHTIKLIHIACAGLSVAGFIVRGFWMLRGSPMLQHRWVRVAPHVIDTLLLLSAILLMLKLRQYPFVHDWLTAKVIALGVYIGLGMVALRHGRSKRARAMAYFAALGVFAYIVGVALTRSATLGLGG
jgi:uncharacterized membrane protein SirB2